MNIRRTKMRKIALGIAGFTLGALAGIEAVLFTNGMNAVATILLALVNYAVFSLIWVTGYIMGLGESHADAQRT